MSTQEYQGVKIFNRAVSMLGSALKVYVYLVDGMLVDSGPHRLEQEIAAFCSGNPVDKIVHTHYHEDHTGNTAYLKSRLNVQLMPTPLLFLSWKSAVRSPSTASPIGANAQALQPNLSPSSSKIRAPAFTSSPPLVIPRITWSSWTRNRGGFSVATSLSIPKPGSS